MAGRRERIREKGVRIMALKMPYLGVFQTYISWSLYSILVFKIVLNLALTFYFSVIK